ncbi:DNA mismatch repair protein MutL [hydrothermal vent metagenome]|uniref:DNA mismatch repair protein MutL n=1 Tax=hydrothermal vent metagenome TaxID=652676 RepID=A0A3B1A4L5_9ZZZZ
MNTTEPIRIPIRQLPVQLANQIAAGEVVERPASIVKELIENSLDAGAAYIEVDIQKGGLQQIKIRDDGHGIPEQEIKLAVQAHCTSKISSFDDLIAIESMGFRGEALASIVSISRFEITSRTVSQEMAWRWSNSSGDNTSSYQFEPASHPVGSSMVVRDIFYNTMARRKFLRSERTEFRHIEDVVKRIALSRFDIEFVLKHNQRVVYRLPLALTADLKIKRIEKLLDKKFVQQALQVSYQASQLSMTGWLSNADYSRGQTDMQYFYVNGRIIKDKVISHALRQVYQAVLPPGRFPAYVLNLKIDPQQVDVNVHPTKHEVRFRQMRLVHDFVNHVIQDSLSKTKSNPLYTDNVFDKQEQPVTEYQSSQYNMAESSAGYSGVLHGHSSSIVANPVSHSKSYIQETQVASLQQSLLGTAVGFCQPYYLISQSQQGMIIVHLLRVAQHQAEQQWLQQLKAQTIETKPFIFPLSIELDEQLCDGEDSYQDAIKSLGFDLSLQTKNTVVLRAAPTVLQHCSYQAVITQLLTSLKLEETIDGVTLIPLLSRFVQLDEQSESKTLGEWQQHLYDIEKTFANLCVEHPYKNKLWRVLSIAEVNKLFQANVSAKLVDE